MYYKKINPGLHLQNYVQCYFVCENDQAYRREDKVFATGAVEIMFNMGEDGAQQIHNGNFTLAPDIQFWGQTIQPFTFTAAGKHSMLGIRFFPHTAACFFDDPVMLFNDRVVDFKEVAGTEATGLHARLLDTPALNRRIELLDVFLLKRLSRFRNRFKKTDLVAEIMQDIQHDDFFKKMNTIAAGYGISSRYLQKIFADYTGLSPNLYKKITRFQKSLALIARDAMSFTSVAYECGYFDQSHFIKDFRFFTGSAPSRFCAGTSSDFIAREN